LDEYSLILSPRIISRTRIAVYELVSNGRNEFEEFVEQIKTEGTHGTDLAKAISIVETASNLQRMPKGKWRELYDDKLPCKLYEAKSNIIRIYLFHQEHKGRVIVMAGKKDDQEKDIKRFKRIVKTYLNHVQ
jgi:hypothetical protein